MKKEDETWNDDKTPEQKPQPERTRQVNSAIFSFSNLWLVLLMSSNLTLNIISSGFRRWRILFLSSRNFIRLMLWLKVAMDLGFLFFDWGVYFVNCFGELVC